MDIVEFEERYREAVIDLWRTGGLVRPWNDPTKDIDRKLTDRTGKFFLLKLNEAIIGTVMAGYDGHRGSIYYLCVHPDHQRNDFGRLLMERCEAFFTGLGCPKVHAMVRTTNLPVLGFYDALNYCRDDVVVLGKRLIPDQ